MVLFEAKMYKMAGLVVLDYKSEPIKPLFFSNKHWGLYPLSF
ncbi:hypothetical protein SAMN03080594_105100 [Arenibacter palladensis]|uniref:Uncharacterized protein n=1 Tax=Arenibacter palladensis TaxID=237373 RepID=A0A1M5CL60_9FLAO|nr:hypothetical protein SAMN03080594_105100 [Arenibacter palladensis]